MVEHLDQEEKLERRALRKANELFLQRLQAECAAGRTQSPGARAIQRAGRFRQVDR